MEKHILLWPLATGSYSGGPSRTKRNRSRIRTVFTSCRVFGPCQPLENSSSGPHASAFRRGSAPTATPSALRTRLRSNLGLHSSTLRMGRHSSPRASPRLREASKALLENFKEALPVYTKGPPREPIASRYQQPTPCLHERPTPSAHRERGHNQAPPISVRSQRAYREWGHNQVLLSSCEANVPIANGVTNEPCTPLFMFSFSIFMFVFICAPFNLYACDLYATLPLCVHVYVGKY